MTTDKLAEALHKELGELLDREWQKILRPVLLKRVGLYLAEVKDHAAEAAQAQPSGDSLVADLHAAGFETFEPWDLGDDTRQTWTCRIGTRAGVHVPPGGDAPMRDAVQSAFMALTGECAEACFSGWGDKFTESELAVIENRAPKAESGR